MSRKHIVYPESRKLYLAIHSKYPGWSNPEIARNLNVSESTLAKLGNSYGLGVSIAKKFSDKFPEYRYMYEWAKGKEKRRWKKSEDKATAPKFKPAMLPSQLRAFVGYAPQRSR